jgi:hydrogenase maturation factor
MATFLTGKIDNAGFEQTILANCGHTRAEVKAGPGFGVDVAVIELPGGQGLALTSDPLSLIPALGLQESAWLSVHLMANDMATTGFAPMYAQMVLNLSPALSKADFETYWGFVHQYCKAIGVSITGGHTGSIEGQNSTIAGGGTMLLTAPIAQILLSKKANVGDKIIVTKQCALSSSALLAMCFPKTVKNKLGHEVYEQASALFYQTSSLPDALAATATNTNNQEVTAMHDVTEGGVLGAIYEMAIASGNGVIVDNGLLPKSDAQEQICKLFDIDSRFCIGAGAMIMAVKPQAMQQVLSRLHQNNIDACLVGEFTHKENGYNLIENDEINELPYFSRDPYWAAFSRAIKEGWQ